MTKLNANVNIKLHQEENKRKHKIKLKKGVVILLDSQELYWTRKRNGVVNEKETENYIKSLEKRISELEELNQCHRSINGELIKRLTRFGGEF